MSDLNQNNPTVFLSMQPLLKTWATVFRYSAQWCDTHWKFSLNGSNNSLQHRIIHFINAEYIWAERGNKRVRLISASTKLLPVKNYILCDIFEILCLKEFHDLHNKKQLTYPCRMYNVSIFALMVFALQIDPQTTLLSFRIVLFLFAS